MLTQVFYKNMPIPTELPAWQQLQTHFEQIQHWHMRDLFFADPLRFDQFSLEAAGLFLDYSKNRITAETLQLLAQLAREAGVESQRDRMFAGQKINTTENRAVLHTALRNPANTPVMVDDENVTPKIQSVREHMYHFANAVRSGEWRGHTGQSITDIVNIGIGGSDLGPLMVCRALHRFAHPRLQIHFVSTIDGDQISSVLKKLNPETTLFIVASKTFSTQETLTNAHTARQWLLDTCGDTGAIAKHFVAISTNAQAVSQFGIDPENMFQFWDWVGGRYSLWSAIGLSIAIYLGPEHFEKLLAGAHTMDRHFCEAPIEKNMPMLLALIGILNRNYFHCHSHLISPYNQALDRFPAYLQQLDMESNGKAVDLDGQHITHYETGPLIWGDSGINGQHAYYQWLHQGSNFIPVDFIVSVEHPDAPPAHRDILMANFFAQTEALMRGKSEAEVREELCAQGLSGDALEKLVPHKIFEGNRPSNSILMQRLDPQTLGALIALYEHKVFVQGAIWNINSYDQWGVELGKQLAKKIGLQLASPAPATDHDASTNGLINYYKKRRQDA